MKTMLLLAILLATSHASFASDADVRTTLRVLQYNNVAEQYLDRQTSVTVRGKPGKEELIVRFAPYGGSLGESWFLFRASSADNYLAHISKYREWSEKATENRDVFTKEIGRAKSSAGVSLKFEFHSGNEASHYLVISLCALGNCAVNEPMYLDGKAADELFSLISKLKAGGLPGEDVGAKYN